MSFIAAALKPRSVLIATDFSEASQKPLRHALAIARFYESKFCLAHVVSSLGLTLAGPDAIAATEDAVLRDTAKLRESLIRNGVLSGIQYKFVVRSGELWPELQEIIRQEEIDLIVIGTRGRRGMSKLLFGSVAEQIFLKADCPVLILGPNSHDCSWITASSIPRRFLFATDLGQEAAEVLAHAIAVANQCRAKLDFLSVVPAVTPARWRHVDGGRSRLEADARMRALTAMANLANRSPVDLRPEFHVEFESKKVVSEWILETAERLGSDLIIMGSRSSSRAVLASRLGSATVYDVACQASSPVLVVSHPSEQTDIRFTPTQIATSSLSEADLIRIHGLGVKW